MKDIKIWLAKRSEPFSLMSGEDFTNGEVVAAHLGVALMIALCVLAEWLAK